MTKLSLLLLILFGIGHGCKKEKAKVVVEKIPALCQNGTVSFNNEKGCDGQTYLNPKDSPYAIPFANGTQFKMGLSNCSSSFHASGQPDQYAYDFDLDEGTMFQASRGGKVLKVEESKSSTGGDGAGNYVYVDHLDGTFGLYYHSPLDGIVVRQGDLVVQGQELGKVGSSGLAGYPHLHFIVVKNSTDYPYEGLAISFNNVGPRDVKLKSFVEYRACTFK